MLTYKNKKRQLWGLQERHPAHPWETWKGYDARARRRKTSPGELHPLGAEDCG